MIKSAFTVWKVTEMSAKDFIERQTVESFDSCIWMFTCLTSKEMTLRLTGSTLDNLIVEEHSVNIEGGESDEELFASYYDGSNYVTAADALKKWRD